MFPPKEHHCPKCDKPMKNSRGCIHLYTCSMCDLKEAAQKKRTTVPEGKKKFCAKWEFNIELVNGPIFLESARQGGPGYMGESFHYCPWCGKPLPCGEQNGLL